MQENELDIENIRIVRKNEWPYFKRLGENQNVHTHTHSWTGHGNVTSLCNKDKFWSVALTFGETVDSLC